MTVYFTVEILASRVSRRSLFSLSLRVPNLRNAAGTFHVQSLSFIKAINRSRRSV
jgi:hypothetical protein